MTPAHVFYNFSGGMESAAMLVYARGLDLPRRPSEVING